MTIDIPEQIKQTRLKLNETQAQFGKRFGVGPMAVAHWEAGRREAPYIVLRLVFDTNRFQPCKHCHGAGYMVKKEVK